MITATRWVLVDQKAVSVASRATAPTDPPAPDTPETPPRLLDPVLVVGEIDATSEPIRVPVTIPDYDSTIYNVPCAVQVVQIPAGHAIPTDPTIARESPNPGGFLDISETKAQTVDVLVSGATEGDSTFLVLVGFDR